MSINQAPTVFSLGGVSSVSSGTTSWSQVIRIPAGYSNPSFSLKWNVKSGGSVTWVYAISESESGTSFVVPQGASKIATSGTSASGYRSSGHDATYFTPEAAPYIKIGASEVGGIRDATLAAWLIIG